MYEPVMLCVVTEDPPPPAFLILYSEIVTAVVRAHVDLSVPPLTLDSFGTSGINNVVVL